MKKILSYTVLMSIAMLIFTACTKDSSSKKYLAGTKWVASYKVSSDYNYTDEEVILNIEFSSEKDFRTFNGIIIDDKNIYGNVIYGTYTYTNETVIFTPGSHGFKYASIKDDVMVLSRDGKSSITLMKK